MIHLTKNRDNEILVSYATDYCLHIKMLDFNVYFIGPRGATVARLTPDQKVACSNHVGVNFFLFPFFFFFLRSF